MNEIPKTSNRLAALRKDKGFNQKQIALYLGIQQSAYSRREIRPTTFSVLEMQKIVDFLNMDFAEQQYVFEWDNYAINNQKKLVRVQRDPEVWRNLLTLTSSFIEKQLIENEKYMRVLDLFDAVYHATELAYELNFTADDYEKNGRALSFFMPLFEMKMRKADLHSKDYRSVRAKIVHNTLGKLLKI